MVARLRWAGAHNKLKVESETKAEVERAKVEAAKVEASKHLYFPN